jgi:hypothetical protein
VCSNLLLHMSIPFLFHLLCLSGSCVAPKSIRGPKLWPASWHAGELPTARNCLLHSPPPPPQASLLSAWQLPAAVDDRLMQAHESSSQNVP